MRFCCRTEFAFQNRLSTDITIFLAILQGRSLRCLLDLEQMRPQAVVPRNPPVLENVDHVLVPLDSLGQDGVPIFIKQESSDISCNACNQIIGERDPHSLHSVYVFLLLSSSGLFLLLAVGRQGLVRPRA